MDDYFRHYEKTATNLEWPKNLWPMLLQTVLSDAVQNAYNARLMEDYTEFKTVKSAILKSYEFVPEAYRQKFRNF